MHSGLWLPFHRAVVTMKIAFDAIKAFRILMGIKVFYGGVDWVQRSQDPQGSCRRVLAYGPRIITTLVEDKHTCQCFKILKALLAGWTLISGETVCYPLCGRIYPAQSINPWALRQ